MRGIATGGSRGPAGANGVGVPVGGTSGQVLAKNSNTDYDTGWVDPSGSQAVTVTKKNFQQRTVLYDNTLTVAGNWDVQNISQDYDHLEIVLQGRGDAVNTGQAIYFSYNGDVTATNYRQVSHIVDGTNHVVGTAETLQVGAVTAASSTADEWAVFYGNIPFYSDTTTKKACEGRSVHRRTDALSYLYDINQYWEGTAAINRITVTIQTGNFIAGSRLQIIGIKEEQVVTDVQNAGTEVAAGWIAADALSYTGADDPSFTVTCVGDQSSKYSAGMKFKLTQATGGTKYFIVTAVTVATDTTLTLYGGTDYNLENEAITGPFFSVVKAPQGFPLDPTKWNVVVTDTVSRSQSSPAANTYYNIAGLSITLPVGVWRLTCKCMAYVYREPAEVNRDLTFSLSTATNSASDLFLTLNSSWYLGTVATFRVPVFMQKVVSMTSKTVYYAIMKTAQSNIVALGLENNATGFIITAECLYL